MQLTLYTTYTPKAGLRRSEDQRTAPRLQPALLRFQENYANSFFHSLCFLDQSPKRSTNNLFIKKMANVVIQKKPF